METNLQMKPFCIWRPDPWAQLTNAFLIMEPTDGVYLPPNLLARPMSVEDQEGNADIVIITPVWRNQAWYAVLLEMSIALRILIQVANWISFPLNQPHPQVANNTLTLAAWEVSGVVSRQEGNRESFWTPLPPVAASQGHKVLTILPGTGGLAGVIKGRLIPFRPMWSLY